MRVQSEVGVGSTFILSLPLVAPHRQNVEEAMRQQTTLPALDSTQ